MDFAAPACESRVGETSGHAEDGALRAEMNSRVPLLVFGSRLAHTVEPGSVGCGRISEETGWSTVRLNPG